MKLSRALLLFSCITLFSVSCNGNTDASAVDNEFVDNINKSLANTTKTITTPYSAVEAVMWDGYDVDGYRLANANQNIVYDIDSQVFLIMQGDNLIYAPSNYTLNSDPYRLFKFTSYYNSRSKYSQYLRRDFAGSDLLILTTGLDMGENRNVKNITYYNSSGLKKDILLNVVCDYLNINASNDNITHYGEANNIYIPNTSVGSFHEYGTSCYIKCGGGTFYFEDNSETDLFEIPEDSNKVVTRQKESSHVICSFNADVRADSKARCKYIDDSETTLGTLQELVNNENYNFYRLNTDARDIILSGGFLEINRSIFFDINGRSITFKHGKEVKEDGETFYPGLFIRSPTSGEQKEEVAINAFLMDSESTLYKRSGINLLDCSIVIQGNKDDEKPVNFYMDSGKIHDIKGSEKVPGPRNIATVLVLGDISSETELRSPKHATFYMYGGYIVTEWGTEAASSEEFRKPIACKCIQPRGNGACVNMIYGDLESFHYCISGQGTTSTGSELDKDGETKINIIGGHLVGGTEVGYESGKNVGLIFSTLYYPQCGEVNINGATFEGPSCINAKSGTINISGGTFIATKKYDESAKATTEGSRCDGSVLFLESNGAYHGAVKSPLNVNVKYANMTSKYGYIVKCSGLIFGDYYAPVSITFNDGIFNYKLDKSTDDLPEKEKSKFTCDIKGGTWTKVEESL